MYLRRTGMPEEGELLLCTVTKIYHHSVFVTLDEYGGISGMIHISEVSPGRIRNLRDFVVEGKKVICKVLKIDDEKKHIDLSLRRVSSSQKTAKNDQIKQEQKAEKIIDFVAKETKKDPKQLYAKIADIILNKYEFLHQAFAEFIAGNFDLNVLNLDKETHSKLEEIIRQRIKPPEVEVKGTLTLSSFAEDGVEAIKSALNKALKKGNDKTTIRYLGGGKHIISIKASNYKEAESVLKNVVDTAISEIKDGTGTFVREEKKSG